MLVALFTVSGWKGGMDVTVILSCQHFFHVLCVLVDVVGFFYTKLRSLLY
jgi:hypothetical protein